MVDRTDLAEVNNLYREFGQIEQALHIIDSGGFIGSIVWVPASPDEPSAITAAGFMREHVPPQMMEMMVALYTQREREICSRLSELGLGGVSPTPRAAAATDRRRK